MHAFEVEYFYISICLKIGLKGESGEAGRHGYPDGLPGTLFQTFVIFLLPFWF